LKKHWKIWVDTGGTFTDCLALDPRQNLQRIKILSSGVLRGTVTSSDGDQLSVDVNWPVLSDIFQHYQLSFSSFPSEKFEVIGSDLSAGKIFLDREPGNRAVGEFEISSGEEAPIMAARLATSTSLDQSLPPIEMRLGSTRGTNALLEKKGCKVVFITTMGHRDMLKIGNQQRPDLFALNITKAQPFYDFSVELEERILSNGEVQSSLSDSWIDHTAVNVKDLQGYAFAVCLLNAHKNPRHENQIKEQLNTHGIERISLSHELVNEIGVLSRAQTTVVNAYLSEVIEHYLERVSNPLSGGRLKVMTSAGGLVDAHLFSPKDSLMSGPAGGVVGSAAIAKKLGFSKILSFDMGGTSTDVSKYDDGYDYKYLTEINSISISSPTIAIETVAAGGGSICDFDGYKLTVGPESAGATPGPACYGNGGPLAITDINLLLGRIDDENFSIPLNKQASAEAFEAIRSQLSKENSDEDLLHGFIKIANEKMAEAIRKISVSKGYNTSEYALLAFGGAGGQHACGVSDILNISEIVIPYDAGLLSAFGMGQAEVERFVTQQLLVPLNDLEDDIDEHFVKMLADAVAELRREGVSEDDIYVRNRFLYMRFKGQESTIEVEYEEKPVLGAFKKAYRQRFGHWLDQGAIEVESLKIVAATKGPAHKVTKKQFEHFVPTADRWTKCYTSNGWEDVPVFDWEELKPGALVSGPSQLQSQNSTIFLDCGWQLSIAQQQDAILTKKSDDTAIVDNFTESAELELFTNRFKSVADDMGAILQRTSFSVNVKDRLDFSCAVLDGKGLLVANAPHIPVHLGSLGVCVRSVAEVISMEEGDVVITNHPAYGGSHLPDVTLIAPVFYDSNLIGFVANRAHHAELGGKTPGSMPADARCLGEEGVVIPPMYLVKKNEPRWNEIREVLTSGPFPTRAIDENLADLNGALASIQTGIHGLSDLCEKHGAIMVKTYMQKLLNYSGSSLLKTFKKLVNVHWRAQEYLDDGSEISVSIFRDSTEIVFNFEGSSPVHPGNLNANMAIVNSAVIYVLRLLLEEPLPLNEGLMKHVKIVVPECFLKPVFDEDPMKSPAVVGGNTETSQRIVDTLSKALRLAACSQGTMNNLIFGNDQFGFYETIGGGVGAGKGFVGASAVHQHMTNTRITDPEILEFRYPVILEKMEIRKGSGGKGAWNGGDGIIRQLLFTDDVVLTILSQHRNEKPYGMQGGESGMPGKQMVIRKSGEHLSLGGIETIELKKGDRIIIETPGGGGYGLKKEVN